MHGFRSGRINNPLLIITFLCLICAGCGTSQESRTTSSDRKSEETLKEFLRKHEASFDPSPYLRRLTTEIDFSAHGDSAPGPGRLLQEALPETVAGYRVQVLLTQDIDQASTLRTQLATLFPDDWVYIIYELPYYKVRAGNFLEKSEAASLVRELSNLGYKNPWVVPDQVLKNPPPRSRSIETTPAATDSVK